MKSTGLRPRLIYLPYRVESVDKYTIDSTHESCPRFFFRNSSLGLLRWQVNVESCFAVRVETGRVIAMER